MSDPNKIGQSSQTPPVTGFQSGTRTPPKGKAFGKEASATSPSIHVGSQPKSDNFHPVSIIDRHPRKLTLNEQLKFKLLWLGQAIFRGSARSWLTDKALNMLDSAAQAPGKDYSMARKVQTAIETYQLPMNPSQQQRYKQLCARFQDKPVNKPVAQVENPRPGHVMSRVIELYDQDRSKEALPILLSQFVDGASFQVLKRPLMKMAADEDLPESDLISQLAFVLTDVVDEGEYTPDMLQNYQKLAASMVKLYPEETKSQDTLSFIEQKLS